MFRIYKNDGIKGCDNAVVLNKATATDLIYCFALKTVDYRRLGDAWCTIIQSIVANLAFILEKI